MSNEYKKIYIYKNRNYSYEPIKNYWIIKEEYGEYYKYITIKKRYPIIIHVLFIVLLVIPLIFVNIVFNEYSVKSDSHILRVPDIMYYNYKSNTIDLDIINDDSNNELINIELYDNKGNIILSCNGIEPGHSIGSIDIDEYEFSNLPMLCTLKYYVYTDKYSYKTLNIKVIVVDILEVDKNNVGFDF